MWLSELLVGLIIMFVATAGAVDPHTNAVTVYEAPVYLDVSCGAVEGGMWKCSLTVADPNLEVTYRSN